MVSSIPYDHPSLVLGNIVDTAVLKLLKQIANLQAKTDAARDKLNAHIMMKRSLGMTLNELAGLNIDVTEIGQKIKDVDAAISQAANNYMSVSLANEDAILKLREQITELEIDDSLESPVDFSVSRVKPFPLSSESLKLDAQYFSFEEDSSTSSNIISNIETYIKESTENLGSKSANLAHKAVSQIKHQQKNHGLSGTLIITASCTHKNAALVEPIRIDVDKAISVWNNMKKNGLKLSPEATSMRALKAQSGSDDDASISIISGAAYGSSFIGMVHFLKTETTAVNPNDKLMTQLQEKMRLGSWLANASGELGVDPSVSDDVRKMLNMYSVNSHVSLVVMGAAPSIASNRLSAGIKSITETGMLKATDDFHNNFQKETLGTGIASARQINRMSKLTNAKDQGLIQGLGNIDSKDNSVMDINSLMSAFENYLTAIGNKDGITGTPINFYLKKITASQIATWWLNKYYPEKESPVKKTAGNNDLSDKKDNEDSYN